MLQAFDESIALSELGNRLNLPDEEFDEAVRSLEEKEVVIVDKGEVVKQSTTL